MSFPGPNQPPSNGGGNKPNGGNNPFTNPFSRNNDGKNGGSGANGNKSNGPRPFWQSPWLWVVVVALLAVTMFQLFAGAGSQTIDTKDGMQILNGNTVEYATIVDNTQQVKLKLSSDYSATDPDTGRTKNYGKNVQFYYTYAQSAAVVKAVQKADPAKGWTASMQQTSIWTYLLTSLLPFLIIFGLFWFLMSRMGGAAGGMFGMGGKKNSGKLLDGQTPTTKFSDVAGEDAAVQEVEEIKDFLKDPSRYKALGARIPRGVLLYGPPGTGKTLLARAIAGEAGVPFYSMAGSDFVEMFVGVGASRVRDLFKEAAKVAPCIVFIDEIDTIGKSRDNRMGGNDEREQTLNQLLAEMDGFDPTKGIILLAATNRPEVLDQALLRPGRFDRRITIDRPNLAGRIATLQVHTRNIKLAEDVNLKKVALATAGCVGADLANLVNEAALRAVRKGRKLVTQEDLLAAFELVIAGTEKKGSVLTEFEKKLVAYHEVGHAMVAYKQKNTEPVQKITIVPHTQGSLGYTLLMPEEDKTELRTRDELMAKIMVSMGGRAAEEVVMNTMTNGASQDIQDATNVARNMVAMFGMSDEFGMMALASRRNQYLDGGYGMDCAQDTAARMDQAVKDILDQCYQQAVEVIKASREDMDKVVAYLLEKETITGAEMVAIIEGRDPELVENPYASTRAEDKAFRPSSPETIEAPAKKVHMISQKIESPEEPAQEGQPENPVSDPSPSGGDAPQESGSTPSEPPKDTP